MNTPYDVKPIRDYDVFVGKTMEFKVVKINQEFKNVVVSHKALIVAELEQQKKEIIVVADRFHINLRTRQECFDTEYVHNHTVYSSTLAA